MLPSEREALLWRLADLIEQHAAEFAEIESLDNGKTRFMASIIDVPGARDYFRYMAGWATKIEGTTMQTSIGRPPGREVSYLRVARAGRCRRPDRAVEFSAGNGGLEARRRRWPSGCTCILKPAEQTPLSALRLGELIREAGFPPGVVNILTGEGETTGAALVAHPGVDKIAFTGSTEVGKLINKSATDTPQARVARTRRQIAGDRAAGCGSAGGGRRGAGAIFFNCGSGVHRRLAALRSQHDLRSGGRGRERRRGRHSSRAGLGSGHAKWDRWCRRSSRSACSATSSRAASRARRWPPAARRRRTPATSSNRRCWSTCARKCGWCARRSSDRCWSRSASMSSTRWSRPPTTRPTDFGASIWTNNLSAAQRLVPRIKAGTVWVNCHNMVDPNMPFGGFKQSGFGREHGRVAMDMYTELKSVCMMV